MNVPFLPLNVYIPDGEAHVFGDRVYLFGSHDRAGGDSYCLEDYEFYSAPVIDLTDWSSRGISYRAKQDPEYSSACPSMYTPDCVCGNDGRYYIYYVMAGFHGAGGYSGPVLNNGWMEEAESRRNKKRRFPKIAQAGNDVFITGITQNTRIGIRYFQFDGQKITLYIRIKGTCDGIFKICQGEKNEKFLGAISVRPSTHWKIYKTTIYPISGKHTLSFLYKGKGMGEFDKFKLENSPEKI